MRQLVDVVTLTTKIAVALRTLEDGAGFFARLAPRARLGRGFVLDQRESFVLQRSVGFVLDQSAGIVLGRSQSFGHRGAGASALGRKGFFGKGTHDFSLSFIRPVAT
jgi:hypothetical protein